MTAIPKPVSLIIKIKAPLLLFISFILVLSACSSQPLSQPTAKSPQPSLPPQLPDLTITSMSLVMQGQDDKPCVDSYGPYEIKVTIKNQGTAPANSIVVERVPGAQDFIESLGPGESQAVQFPAIADNGAYSVRVDPQNQIVESDEDNNNRDFLAPTPTPPILCPTAQPTTTPVPPSN